jgi:hypothetical protein
VPRLFAFAALQQKIAADCGTAFSDGAAIATRNENKNAAPSVQGKTRERGPVFTRLCGGAEEWCGEVIRL